MVYALPRDEGALFSHSKNKYQMKKRKLRVVTIAALLAALFGSGGGTAWGQNLNCNNDYGADEWAKISTPTSASPFYPATPTVGIPLNSSAIFPNASSTTPTWATPVPVAAGTIGRITLGGDSKQNVIYNIRNYEHGGLVVHLINVPSPPSNACGTFSTSASSCGTIVHTPGPTSRCSGAEYDYVAHPGVYGSLNMPDNNGLTVPSNFYNRETQVRILGNTSAGAWVEMDHILMENIEWLYRRHIIGWNNCEVYRAWSNTNSGPPHYTCTGPGGRHSLQGSNAYVNSITVIGGNVDGHVILDAGATVSLTSDLIGIRNTASGTYPGGGGATGSLLDLPANDPYTLQVRAMFEASTFNGGADIHGFPNLAPQAVLGLWTGIDKDVTTNNTDGGTFLIGNATQNQIKLTLNSGTNGGTLANYYYHTNTEERPSGVWNNASVTKTKAPAPSHAVNISGSSSGTDITFNLNSTGDMTIENTQCDSLNFNGKFAPTIGGDGALRINPTTWDLVSPMRLTHLTVFSPTNLPNTMLASTRGFTHFAEDVDLNFTTKTGFLLLEGGKITFDKKYTYNRGGVGTTVTGKPASQIGSHQVVLARGGCVDSANIKAIGDVSSVSESQLPVLWWANQDIQTYSDVLFHQKDATHGPLTLFAGQDFVAYSRPKKFTIKQENEDEIFIGALRDIRTQTEDKIERVKKGITKMIAGQDIDIQNSFLFDGQEQNQDPGDVFLMYAKRDI